MAGKSKKAMDESQKMTHMDWDRDQGKDFDYAGLERRQWKTVFEEASMSDRPFKKTKSPEHQDPFQSSASNLASQTSSASISSYVPHNTTNTCTFSASNYLIFKIESNIVRCPNPKYAEKMIAAIDAVRVRGDSVGGVVTCIVRNVPRGLGSPVFDKLEAELAKAAMSLPATKGFEFGSGFAGTFLTGSEHNDEFFNEHGRIRTRTNRSGGIQGGISNGEIINMRIAFKPTSTIGRKQNTVTRDKHETELIARGRHDPCVVPRAVPMVESMVALVLVDQLLAQAAQNQLFPINADLQEPLQLPKLESANLHL